MEASHIVQSILSKGWTACLTTHDLVAVSGYVRSPFSCYLCVKMCPAESSSPSEKSPYMFLNTVSVARKANEGNSERSNHLA